MVSYRAAIIRIGAHYVPRFAYVTVSLVETFIATATASSLKYLT